MSSILKSPAKVIVGRARASYAHVFEPKAIDEKSEPKFSVSLLIDKEDTETLVILEQAIANAFEAGRSKTQIKEGQKVPATFKYPLRDGDAERPDDENYAGKMFINCSSNQKPQVVTKAGVRIESSEGFYSGCYCKASINLYAFNVSGNKGIAAGLGNLMFLEDGGRLSGGSSAADDFGIEDDDLMG